ncbi:hypothetical protein METH_22540 (plasmid) [Leisingera methylohalidivorans DSM 14336]|uniref:Uncharacterized protein n=1 Tax=Leisingera methylohalidivorans DSM 14336 TaxID=999552 RepID=V9W1R8_9RHOB|nr:hypothetical protein METH_22540 [Leisingera methylohalidivorans DSM 14336]
MPTAGTAKGGPGGHSDGKLDPETHTGGSTAAGLNASLNHGETPKAAEVHSLPCAQKFQAVQAGSHHLQARQCSRPPSDGPDCLKPESYPGEF